MVSGVSRLAQQQLRQLSDVGGDAPGLIAGEQLETAGLDVERRLKAQTYDCVVIGAGIRLPPLRRSSSGLSAALFLGLARDLREPPGF